MRFKIPSRQPTSFRASALYLAGRSHGHQPSRVSWMFSRNLETEEPSKAAARMEALAAQNTRCKAPRYHFILTFDPVDEKRGKVTPEVMRDIANEAIERLGLRDHQLLVYAHKDTAHPHMHFLVNRIHPTTLRAWSRTDEGRRLTALCRDIAKERGLNIARDLAAERRQQDRSKAISDGEYRMAEREGREPTAPFDQRGLTDLRQNVRSDFMEATSWDDLTGRLSTKGLRLYRKGQGLMLTDGDRAAKLSDLGKGVRFKELEERFQLPYDVWHGQRMARAATDEALRGPKTHDGMPPDEQRRAKAQHHMEQVRAESARDPVEMLDEADQDFQYWSGIQGAYRSAEHRIAMENRRHEKGQLDMARQQSWEQRRHQEMMSQIASIFADAERARSAWLRLEVAHGAQAADEIVRQNLRVLGETKADIFGTATYSSRQAEKAMRAMLQKRRQWRDARDKVSDAFGRLREQRHALDVAVDDYKALQQTGGDTGWVRQVVLEKVKARARALDRVNGDLIHRARLADERKEQLHRAWRRHAERKRQRERERQTRELGL